ncbi:glycoside hydrolase family 18 protein [Gonapodya prolifera JEL478]|uniref:Glycoside hydrolase family 18 protein n=1 Tax=Gonapodya prolifera (strain JEL478) TaxID=1344416 RepID=A0A139A064_GONPJ|nr:glycoside hydrolase family 18 protein [Gonapodya prolifera JEL478]|eukprot:KXS10122.1 glycoside hydrolase family 18 protein [Gonapodya prolifera JEL478]
MFDHSRTNFEMDREEWTLEQNGEILARRRQIPLVLAWATSVHKAQGQTLDRLKVDLRSVLLELSDHIGGLTSNFFSSVLNFDPKKVKGFMMIVTWFFDTDNAEFADFIDNILKHPRGVARSGTSNVPRSVANILAVHAQGIPSSLMKNTLLSVYQRVYTIDVSTNKDSSISWASNFKPTKINKLTTQLTMQSWTPPLQAGIAFTEQFGGNGTPPIKMSFVQINPLVTPINTDVCGTFPSPRIFVPYVDMMTWLTPDLVAIATSSGQMFHMIAFVTASGQKAAWAGTITMDQRFLVSNVNDLQKIGGDVAISFGGANGVELSQAIKNIDELVNQYKTVINLYSVRWIDFDIEGAAVEQSASVDRRNKAIKKLQRLYGTKLQVSYTLPIFPSGLTAGGIALLKNALINGARINDIGIMTMDFGDSAWPPTAGTMAQASQAAALALERQLKDVGLPSKTEIQIIPMIGVNDVPSKIFTIADAKSLVAWGIQSASQGHYPVTEAVLDQKCIVKGEGHQVKQVKDFLNNSYHVMTRNVKTYDQWAGELKIGISKNGDRTKSQQASGLKNLAWKVRGFIGLKRMTEWGT